MEQDTSKRRGRPASKMLKPVTKSADTEQTVNAAAPAEAISAPVSERPSMRPAMREEDPRVAAARRAEQIMNNLGGDMDQGTDMFQTPPAPDGWTYEWKRKNVTGEEQNSHITSLSQTGWEFVPTDRHPETMPLDNKNPIIERKGMALMQRPKIISDKMNEIEKRKARDQVIVKQQQLNDAPQNHFDRNHPSAKARVSTGYEPIPVPQDK